MKKSITLNSNNGQGIDINIVKGKSGHDHSHQYSIFDLRDAIDGIGLIGVEEGDIFAICFSSTITERLAFSIYLDGINIIQTSGIKSLSKISESNRENYWQHPKFLAAGIGRYYSDCYVQLNGQNRQLVFTQKKNTGINENLIQDPSRENRIEIYVWKEQIEEEEYDDSPATFIKRSKIGAGEATYKKFKKTSDLENPLFIGKAMFIHQPAKNLKHLGETVIPARIQDPMDQVPKS